MFYKYNTKCIFYGNSTGLLANSTALSVNIEHEVMEVYLYMKK